MSFALTYTFDCQYPGHVAHNARLCLQGTRRATVHFDDASRLTGGHMSLEFDPVLALSQPGFTENIVPVRVSSLIGQFQTSSGTDGRYGCISAQWNSLSAVYNASVSPNAFHIYGTNYGAFRPSWCAALLTNLQIALYTYRS